MKVNIFIKIRHFALVYFLLVSCQTNKKADTGKILKNLSYFKDKQTGLCFAAINSEVNATLPETVTSITCVPCDSLKQVILK